VAANKTKGRVQWHTDGPTPEINSMAVMIDWLTPSGSYNQWRGRTTKMGIANKICQVIKDKELPLKGQGEIYI